MTHKEAEEFGLRPPYVTETAKQYYLLPGQIEELYGVRVTLPLCECDLMRERLRIAEEALEFYASHFQDRKDEPCGVVGTIARAALEKIRGKDASPTK